MSKEKDRLSKENQTLAKQLEDVKQGIQNCALVDFCSSKVVA